MLNQTSTTAIARTILLAGILLVVTVLAARTFLPAFAQTVGDPEEIEYAENGINPVATFTADDPEGATIDWTLDGTHAALFDITSGVLTFIVSPDFEDAAAPTDNIYMVTVQAEDGTTSVSEYVVEVEVTNVDEMGEVELSTLAPKEGVGLTATLTDEDVIVLAADSISWTWERSMDGTTGWMTAATSTTAVANNTYRPVEDDAGYFLRVTASYDDDEGKDKKSHVVSDNKVVMKDYVNRPPTFDDDMRDEDDTGDATTTRSVMEDASAGTAVGAPVSATDTDATNSPEVLTYTLDGTNNNNDDAPFEIDSSTGQIRVKVGATLNFEVAQDANTDNMYEVTVTATDPGRMESTIDVTIEVIDVNEAPELEEPNVINGVVTAGHTAIDHEENEPANTLISTYTATDVDSADLNNLTWSLTGTDGDDFTMATSSGGGDNTLTLRFKESPNYEAATDRQRNNVYNVTVNVTDSAGNSESRNVAVTVTNLDEAGTITLSHIRAEVGARITANLSDLDGVRSSSWSWTQLGSNMPVSTSASYTPVEADQNLTVTATYTDGHGPDKTVTVNVIQVNRTEDPNRRPVFKFDGATTTSATADAIQESDTNPSINVDSGDFRVEDGDQLIYTLGGDTSTFRIENRESAVITLQPEASLDFERKRSYRVTVRATDPSGDNTTLTLTIPIEDVDESPVIAAGGEKIDYSEIKNSRPNTDRVFDYNASDPERKSLTWSLSGDNADQFDLDQNGVLTFKSPPDYEGANTPGGKVFNVTVEVTDGTTIAADRAVPITLINVDEPGEISMAPTLQPKENQAILAALTDPDGQPDNPGEDTLTTHASTTWQWARSSSRNGPWADIEATSTEPAVTSEDPMYTPRMADRGMYLRATATYSDDQGDDKAAHAITDYVVLREDYENTPPKFNDDMRNEEQVEDNEDATTTRSVMENAAAGTPVGAPVEATDIGSDEQQEVLTYSLHEVSGSAVDDDKFEIDRRTGQIKVKASNSLNFESREDANTDGNYEVVVRATDPEGSTSASDITVTIEVTNQEEAPEIADMLETEGLSSTITDEHTGLQDGPSTSTILSLYRATDDEDDPIPTTTPKWTLTGPDRDMFDIATTTAAADGDDCDSNTTNCAKLTFENPVDYENPADSGRNNVYNITVNVTDSNGMSDSRDVVVEVENVNEDGTITLSHLQPEVGSPFTATLTDPDGGVRDVTWQWATCANRSDDTSCTTDSPDAIPGTAGAMRAYTPATSTPPLHLHVTATYSDAATPTGETAEPATAVSFLAIQPEVENNDPPSLPDIAVTRTILENMSDPEPVKDGAEAGPVLASDLVGGSQETLLYELEGPDAAFFTIDTTTENKGVVGQIRVGPDTKLDYDDGRRFYTVVVKATDPAGESDTVTVNIEVLDDDELPVLMRADVTITGRSRVEYLENGTAPVETYGVSGSDANGATWALSGPDNSVFDISSAGVLTFNSPPDFEAPADTGGNNVYDVTVEATSGGVMTPRSVTVTVENVDEPGTITFSSLGGEARVGVEITVELDEGDEETNVTWRWGRTAVATDPCTAIPGETSNTYTPVEADVDNHLCAMVTYDDPLGIGKTLTQVTEDTVAPETAAGTPGTVNLSPSSGLVSGDSVTASLTDPDNPTNQVWRWQRSANGSANWSNISGATSASYITTGADAGNYLRASVTYDDSSGTGLNAGPVATTDRVRLHRYDGNANGAIERTEVIDAIEDYLFPADPTNPTTTRDEVIEVIKLYLFP